MEFPPQILDQIRELYASAKEEAARCRAEAEEASQAERVWADCERFLTKGWAIHILSLIEKEASRLKRMRAGSHPAILVIDEAYRFAKEEADFILRRYPAFLEEACRHAGLALDSGSRHPRYLLDSGFFILEIDEKKLMARLANHEGRLVEIPADVAAVVESIQRERKRIFDRPFNGPKFLKTLRVQYKAVLKREKQLDGASVPIRHITRRLGKNIKGFRTDEFLIDLSRLAADGPFEIEGRRLDLQQTKDTNQGMLLWGSVARGYVGFVVFKEV